METKETINHSLFSAVHRGSLEEVSELINTYGLSYSQAWGGGYTLLRDAVGNNQTAMAQLLLTRGARVNSRNSYRNPSDTPLHFAVDHFNVKIVKMILEKGGDTEARNGFGETPLYNAIERENCFTSKLKCIELLLKHGANATAINYGGVTPFHLAAKYNIKIVKMFLDKGFDIDVRDQNGQTPLYYAIENNNMEVAELLLKRGANVNVSGKHGTTLLHLAASNCDIEIVKMILDKGVNIDVRDQNGQTPLYNAIGNNITEVTELLLKHGANVNVSDKCGTTPLHLAVSKCDIEKVKIILDKGVDIDVRDQNGQTPLYYAIRNEKMEVTEFLLKHGANVNVSDKHGTTPLHIAAEKVRYGNYNYNIFELLLKHGPRVDIQNKDGKTVLVIAVEKGSYRMVEDILKYSPDINDQSNKNLLKIAVLQHGNNHKLVQDLLEYGFIVPPEDANDPELLNISIENGYVKIIEDLLKQGADVNMLSKSKLTPLHCAAKYRKEEIAKLLLSYRADINVQDDAGKTPLFYAVENADLNMTKLLLTFDADVNASDKYGNTALFYMNNAEIAKLLLNKGANLEARSNGNAVVMAGSTALHIATQNGHNEVVKVLLEYGAKVNSKTENNTTPLHLAARRDHVVIIKFLLKFGANIDARDNHGRTALHLASYEGHVSTVNTLLLYGADINIKTVDNSSPLDYTKQACSNYTYNSFDKINAREKVVQALKHHIIKLKTANLFVNEEDLEEICYMESNFQKDCKKEIASMKNEKMYNLNISFYDILVKRSLLARYMRKENIVEVLKSGTYRKKFPIYDNMITNNFRQGKERKKLLEQGSSIFHFFFYNFLKLPFLCSEKIISYFTNQDLRVLMEACKPLVSNIENSAGTSYCETSQCSGAQGTKRARGPPANSILTSPPSLIGQDPAGDQKLEVPALIEKNLY